MNKKQLIFLDIDGILPEVLYPIMDDPETSMSRVSRGGIRVERAVTIFPAVTLCCQASMFTGVYPATHGIVGNSWFDRAMSPPMFRKYTDAKTALGNYGFGLFGWPTIIMPQRPDLQYANNDMNNGIKTVYEMMKEKGMTSWQLFNQYSRGVDKWIKPSRTEMIIFALCHEELIHNNKWDRATFRHLIREMKKEELPDLLVVYESGHDNNSHEHGPATQDAYFRETVDPLFGMFFDELEKSRPLDEYYFIITSDHGQAAVTREKQYVITMEILSEILAGIPGGGFKLFEKKIVKDGDTAVVCTESGAAQIHLMNRATNSWNDSPRFEEDVLPTAEAFEKVKKEGGFFDVIMLRREFGADYEVYENGKIIPIEEFFSGKEKAYPDAVERMKGINCSRSGDMIVLMDYSTGYYYGDKVKGGEHGNLNELDSMIPLVITGPDIPNKTIPSASLVDVVPTMGKILGFDTPTAQGHSLL